MKKSIALSGLILSLSFFSNGENLNINEIEEKLQELREKHALECSPKEVGLVESYLENLKISQNETKDATNIVYPIKINKLLMEIEKNINSDKDKDGIPCYKEIELGLNPNVPDKIEKTKVAEKKEEQKLDVATQHKEEQKVDTSVLNQPVRVHFYTNSAKIKKEYLPYLNVVSKYMKTHPDIKLKIVGFTDDRGSKKYNDKLALKRAEAVRNYLIKQGLPKNRIEIEGIGKDKYIMSNKKEIDRFTNRRAEFYIISIEK